MVSLARMSVKGDEISAAVERDVGEREEAGGEGFWEVTSSTNVGDQGPEMAEMWMLRLDRSEEKLVRREELISRSEFGEFGAVKGGD